MYNISDVYILGFHFPTRIPNGPEPVQICKSINLGGHKTCYPPECAKGEGEASPPEVDDGPQLVVRASLA